MALKERTPDAGGDGGSGDVSSLAANDSTRDNQAQDQKQASLIPHWRGGKAGYLYDVQYAGELIVAGSRDPEHDLARALLVRGVTGLIELVHGESGKPRTFVNVVPAARYCIFDGGRDRLRRRLWEPYQGGRDAPHSPEDGEGGSG